MQSNIYDTICHKCGKSLQFEYEEPDTSVGIFGYTCYLLDTSECYCYRTDVEIEELERFIAEEIMDWDNSFDAGNYDTFDDVPF
jgi:uncharacterized cysteine cluster protein YcgN (CxxCxxCC family)